MGTIRVYGVESWYVPCLGWDMKCYEETDRKAAEGKVPMKLAGFHHYTTTWMSDGGTGDASATVQDAAD
jgi:hypothetical protein